MKTISLFLPILLLVSRADAQNNPQDIAQKTFPSIALLIMHDFNGQPISVGSGFFVREDILASNIHVIEGAAGGYAKLVGKTSKFKIEGVAASDEQHDLALLKVEGVSAPPLLLGDSEKPAVGDTVYSVGNPRGLEGTFAQGIISGIRKDGNDTLFQITAPISPGSSGGPIINDSGKVIGIAVASFKGGQNLNFAIPAAYLSKLLPSIKPSRSLADAKPKSRSNPIIADFTGSNLDGIEIGNFLWSSGIDNFSLSIRNKLKQPIQNVEALVIFHDEDDKPIDVASIKYEGVILPGLAKRAKGRVDEDIKKLTSAPRKRANEAAKAEIAKRDTRINELESQKSALDQQASDLKGAIGGLEKSIVDTEKKLAASEGDREFLLKEHKRLQIEKADLERQFNDLSVMRTQVAKLKDELSIARRLEWIRTGIYGIQAQKGAERLDGLQAQKIAIGDAPETKLEFRVLNFDIAD